MRSSTPLIRRGWRSTNDPAGVDAGVADHLAFKGGTCLRKLFFGLSGRFSEDLDYTLDTDRPDDDVLTEIVQVFNREHHGITFTFDEYYKTDADTSFGGDVLYRHAWNSAGRFRLQVSLRERPTLPVVSKAMQHQAYFNHLEFDLFEVRSLEPVEMIAEKVRAAFQRAKGRDLYDLHRLSTMPFDAELLRRLVVLKLWQVVALKKLALILLDKKFKLMVWKDINEISKKLNNFTSQWPRTKPRTRVTFFMESVGRSYLFWFFRWANLISRRYVLLLQVLV